MHTDAPAMPPPNVQHVHHHHHAAAPQRDPTIAVLLEVIPGFFQVFGIGHIYAGRVGLGLLFMFGYWLLMTFNALLVMVLIGFVTWPLCWLAAMILSPILAARACRSPAA